jgi:hypothetical protein
VVGRAVGVVAIGIAVGLLLTACVPAPPDPTEPPKPSPTRVAAPPVSVAPTAVPAPTPKPIVDVDPVVTQIVVRPEHLDLVNGSGVVVEELSYDAEAGAFIDAISNVLGGPPDVADRPGGHEWFPSTRYTWPGMAVVDDHEPGEFQADMNVSVTFTHPIVGNGISVSTTQGFRPGDDLRALADQLGEEWHGTGYEEFPVETGPDLGDRMYDSWNDTYWKYANANAVSVSQWAPNDPSVTSVVSAPWNFGIGHV